MRRILSVWVIVFMCALFSVLHSFAQDLWWVSEYPALIKAVNNAPGHMLTTSYRTGPRGHEKVTLCLSKKSKNSLVLEVNLPKQALFLIDEKTSKKIPSETTPLVTMRDHNLDGIPDDFMMQPGHPRDNVTFTKDGFIKCTNTDECRGIMVQWTVGIGFSINHFLHGVDSAMPRQTTTH